MASKLMAKAKKNSPENTSIQHQIKLTFEYPHDGFGQTLAGLGRVVLHKLIELDVDPVALVQAAVVVNPKLLLVRSLQRSRSATSFQLTLMIGKDQVKSRREQQPLLRMKDLTS